MDEKEPLYKAAARELQEETSVKPEDVDLFQVLDWLGVVSLIGCYTEHRPFWEPIRGSLATPRGLL